MPKRFNPEEIKSLFSDTNLVPIPCKLIKNTKKTIKVFYMTYLVSIFVENDFKEFSTTLDIVSKYLLTPKSSIRLLKKELIDEGFMTTRMMGAPPKEHFTINKKKISEYWGS